MPKTSSPAPDFPLAQVARIARVQPYTENDAMTEARKIARAIRCIKATYNIGTAEAIARWRSMSAGARQSWLDW